jgi:hypothetical protein
MPVRAPTDPVLPLESHLNETIIPPRESGCNRSAMGDDARMNEAPDLNDAVARLKALRSTWNPGDVIDEESGLTADDLDVILSFVADFPSSD